MHETELMSTLRETELNHLLRLLFFCVLLAYGFTLST